MAGCDISSSVCPSPIFLVRLEVQARPESILLGHLTVSHSKGNSGRLQLYQQILQKTNIIFHGQHSSLICAP
jgi:hypothetical protein